MIDKIKKGQSLSDWLFYLEQQHPTEIELGLDRINDVAQRANVLDLNAKQTVLVAGTNGKGTTIRFIELYLLSQGYSVGVFSSPHLFTYNERVRINGDLLPDTHHIESFEHIESHKKDTSLTYFEFSTLAAFKIFQQHELDVVLVEVGLGGRLDSTNIIQQDISVITSIDLDHTDWLGDTREKIGFEKAGIFKQGNIAIIGEPNPPETINQQANAHNIDTCLFQGQDFGFKCNDLNGLWTYFSNVSASLTKKDNLKNTAIQTNTTSFEELQPSLVPLANLATALQTLRALDVAITQDQTNQIISEFSLVGRMQILQTKPMQMVDVAHNPHAVKFLADTLKRKQGEFGCKKVTAVVAMMKDKDISATLNVIKDQVDEWLIAGLPGNSRAASSEHLASIVKNVVGEKNTHKIIEFDNVKQAWIYGQQNQSQEALLLGFGSFYTVAEILEIQSSS